MSNHKAVIMSIKGHFAIAYTQDRRFIKIPVKDSYKVGHILNLKKQKNKYLSVSWQHAAAAVVAVLIIFASGIFFPFTQPPAEAYLSLGLNSSGAELWVGPDNKVIKANFTGNKAVLKKVDVKGLNVYQAVTAITNEANEAGLLKDNNQDNLLLVNYANLSEKDGYQIQETKIKQSVEAGLSNPKSQGVIMVNKNDKHYVAEASDMGLTATQYFVLETSCASGHNITADQIKHGHIRAVLQEAGTTPEELFEPEETRDLNTQAKTYANSTPEIPLQNSMGSHQIYIDSKGADSQSGSGTSTSTGTGTSSSPSPSPSPNTLQRSNSMDSEQTESQPEDFAIHGNHAGEISSFNTEHEIMNEH